MKDNRFVAAARGLAGLLAGALLICELLAANGQVHGALHHKGNAAPNSCVLCLFVKGLVDSPDSAPVPTEPVWSFFDSVPQIRSIAWVDFTYLVSLSRAPPALASSIPVVA